MLSAEFKAGRGLQPRPKHFLIDKTSRSRLQTCSGPNLGGFPLRSTHPTPRTNEFRLVQSVQSPEPLYSIKRVGTKPCLESGWQEEKRQQVQGWCATEGGKSV